MTPPSSTYLCTSVPREWHQKYTDLAQQKGVSLEDFLQQILGDYLAFHASSLTATNSLQQEIETLKERVKRLEISQLHFQDIRLKLQVLEHRLNSSEKIEKIVDSSLPISPISSEKIIEGDEDEPDEILWDFLEPS